MTSKEGLKQELEGLKCQICGQKYCKFKDHSLRRADVFAKLEKTIAKLRNKAGPCMKCGSVECAVCSSDWLKALDSEEGK